MHDSELVREALSGNNLEGSGCFWSSKSCRLLSKAGSSVLPSIEKIIVSDVLPFYHGSSKSLYGRFPGLRELLVTYFSIGRDKGDDLSGFFARLCGSVMVEAISMLELVWPYRMGAVPTTMLATIKDLARDGTGETQKTARWFLERANLVTVAGMSYAEATRIAQGYLNTCGDDLVLCEANTL